ncbi:MAG TPA: helix-turn-helix domain-containing protein [Longimicrobium sp.]|uniref:helix-turn-helix transcriptional regulator n=1 Tax=Longimicrobium sp. TaxID=2029185 RepID=UPI002ED98BE7
MTDIVALPPCAAAVDRLHRAVQMEQAAGVRHRLHLLAGWGELLGSSQWAGGGIAFLNPYADGRLAVDELRTVQARFPALALVAYGDFAGRPAEEPFRLAGLGVRAVLAVNAGDDPAALRRCLYDHVNWNAVDEMMARLAPVLRPAVHGWLERVLRAPSPPRHVEAAAALARCSPRTLARLLADAGLPPPAELLAWRRVLHAARLMDDEERSADSVARALEFSSGSALRRTVLRLTGLRPSELVAGGGLRLACALFLRRCGVAEGEDAAASTRGGSGASDG